MDQCPIQGKSKTLIRLTLQKPEISAGSMDHLAREGFSFFLIIFIALYNTNNANDQKLSNPIALFFVCMLRHRSQKLESKVSFESYQRNYFICFRKLLFYGNFKFARYFFSEMQDDNYVTQRSITFFKSHKNQYI